MKTLRDYIDLVDQKFNQALSEKVTLPADGSTPQTQTVNGVTMNAPANAVQTGSGGVLKTGSGAAVTSGTPAPAPDATAAAKAKLTPSQLKWLGGADATDSAIMARMPKPLPGEAVPGAAPAQAAQPAAAPAAPDTAGAMDDEGNMMPGWSKDENGNPVKVADQDGKTFVEPATQALADKGRQDAAQKAAIASGAQDDATGVDAAVAAQAAAPAQAAQPANRDAMPFGQAFADAKAKGEKQFTWKGKPYAVKMAPAQAAQPAAKPAAPAPYNAAKDSQAANVAPAAPAAGSFTADMAARKKAANPLNIAKESRTDRVDHAFIDELNAMRSIAGLPTKNKW